MGATKPNRSPRRNRSTKPDRSGQRREATPEEYKAMAHPLRLRILRVCLYETHTNKEIAEALDISPATCLHHVRLLARTGFLEQDAPRPGPRGSTEKPYRSTGKSWYLEPPPGSRPLDELASLDATRDELLHSGPGRVRAGARLGLKLSKIRAKELEDRLDALIYEYADAGPDEPGAAYGLFVVFHELD
jgi:DNA-binding CsgD family transcriptional regulator